jgi:FMN phosphatase YigB (HAD superfamily)
MDPDRPGGVGEEVAVALRAVFLDAGNTLVGLDYDTIARRIGAEGHAVDVPAVQAAEARARVRLDPLLAASRSTETADVFTRYVRHVLEELGLDWSEGSERLVHDLRGVNPPFGLWSVCLPEAPRALETLRGLGLRLAVVSNSNGTVARLLEALGLAGWLDAVVDSGVVGFEKPDPRIFRHAAVALGVEPTEAVHVGDLYSVDVVGARAAGARAILLDPFGAWAVDDCPKARDVDAAARLIAEMV